VGYEVVVIASMASTIVGGCCGVARNAQACVLCGVNEPNCEVFGALKTEDLALRHDVTPKIRKILRNFSKLGLRILYQDIVRMAEEGFLTIFTVTNY